jgi:hypothetical protein
MLTGSRSVTAARVLSEPKAKITRPDLQEQQAGPAANELPAVAHRSPVPTGGDPWEDAKWTKYKVRFGF